MDCHAALAMTKEGSHPASAQPRPAGGNPEALHTAPDGVEQRVEPDPPILGMGAEGDSRCHDAFILKNWVRGRLTLWHYGITLCSRVIHRP